jgi:hypothetical protein
LLAFQVHAKSDESQRYLVVLDAAAHAASHVLDLSLVKPDFVTLSFYKVQYACLPRSTCFWMLQVSVVDSAIMQFGRLLLRQFLYKNQSRVAQLCNA